VQPVRQCCRGGLVDDPQHLQARDPSRIFGGLPLLIVEMGRDGDDRPRNFSAEFLRGDVGHLLQDHGADFFGRELFGLAAPSHLDQRSLAFRGVFPDGKGQSLTLVLDHMILKGPPNNAFDVEQRALGVARCLGLGRGSYQSSSLRERDIRRRRPRALAVLQDFHLLLGVVVDGDAGERRA
jgi:hypothetical protein